VDPAIALSGLGMPIVCADLVHNAVDLLTGASAARRSPSGVERLGVLEDVCLTLATADGETADAAATRLAPARRAWRVASLLWERAAPAIAVERGAVAPSWIWR
jgi:hypothetical protein